MRISDCRASSHLKTVPVSRLSSDSTVCPSSENLSTTKLEHYLESLGVSKQRSDALEIEVSIIIYVHVPWDTE